MHIQGSRGIIVGVQVVGVVKIYVPAMEAFREKERQKGGIVIRCN
jgi:hypothetical protein